MKRVYLWKPGTSTENDPVLIRKASVAIAHYACAGSSGRFEGDPVFERVTEGRVSANTRARRTDPSQVPYYSCGDLASYDLDQLGCRNEAMVNRNTDEGVKPWVVGANIAFIYKNPHFKVCRNQDDIPGEGDILDCVEGNPPSAHVCILADWNPEAGEATTYDYGQVVGFKPAGIMRVRKLRFSGGKWWLDGKSLLGFIPIVDIPLSESAIVPDDFEGGTPDDNPYHDRNLDY